MSTNSLIWQKANGRFAMMAFWAIIGVYTSVSYTHLTLPTSDLV